MLSTIKTILKLRAEEHDIKTALAHTYGAPNGIDIPARMALFRQLYIVKGKLDKFSKREIRIALGVEKLREEIRKTPRPELPENIEPPKPLPEDDFLRILLLFVLLAQDKPVQAFLALSFGALALLFAADSPTTPQMPALRMKI
jgi:hypothetical protein